MEKNFIDTSSGDTKKSPLRSYDKAWKFEAEGRIKKYDQNLKQPKYCGKFDWWKQQLHTVNDKITI